MASPIVYDSEGPGRPNDRPLRGGAGVWWDLPGRPGVWVRRIRPDDQHALMAFHDQLSGESVRLRFFGAHPHLAPEEAAHFCTVDFVDRAAFVAHEEGAIVAVARYDGDREKQAAELALVVADRLQHMGLGARLLEVLGRDALAVGYPTLTARVMPVNRSMLGLLAHGPWPATFAHNDGEVHVSLDLSSDHHAPRTDGLTPTS